MISTSCWCRGGGDLDGFPARVLPYPRVILLLEGASCAVAAQWSTRANLSMLTVDEIDAALPHFVRLAAVGSGVYSHAVWTAMRRPSQPIDCTAYGLTTRECAVLELMLDGRTNAEIAVHLNLAVQTVRNHVSSIYGKLPVGSRVELLAWAGRNRLL